MITWSPTASFIRRDSVRNLFVDCDVLSPVPNSFVCLPTDCLDHVRENGTVVCFTSLMRFAIQH